MGADLKGLSATLPATLPDYAQRAQERLTPEAWAYFDGGAGDEWTQRRNVAAWARWGLRPRVLQDLREGHTRVHLLGRELPTPLIVAPMAYQCWAHPDGERGMALAASSQQCGFVLSQHSTTPLQQVAPLMRAEAVRGPLWMQLANGADRGHLLELMAEAEHAGYEALVLSVDAPVQGSRDRVRRLGAQPPAALATPHWQAAPAGPDGLCGGTVEQALRWDDLAWLQARTHLPLLLKGITHPLDARQAARLNVAGVVLSNHGGRVLDTQPATAECLPELADALQGDASLLVDGGIRRGTDVFKALALGAQAVLIGRPCLWGLAAQGAMGAAHVLRLLRDEFEMALALCGCRSPADISRDHLRALDRAVDDAP